MRFLCTPGTKSDIESLIDRYHEINKESQGFFIAPSDERILSKIIWSLRNAKACYMVGNYLGAISLCGMVAEMLAILIYEISNIYINNKPIDKELEVGLFGSCFERLGQENV